MPDSLAAVRLQFPGWHIFRSRPSPGARPRLWATRLIRRRPDNPPDGFAMTVDADTAEELRAELARQDALTDGPG